MTQIVPVVVALARHIRTRYLPEPCASPSRAAKTMSVSIVAPPVRAAARPATPAPRERAPRVAQRDPSSSSSFSRLGPSVVHACRRLSVTSPYDHRPSSVHLRVACRAALSGGGSGGGGGDDDSLGERWRAMWLRAEAEQQWPALKSLARWYGDNPLLSLALSLGGTFALASVLGTLIFQAAFSVLFFALPLAFFSAATASFALLFGFGVVVPAVGFALFTTGATAFATLGTIVAFAVSFVVGSKLVDVFLSPAADSESLALAADDANDEDGDFARRARAEDDVMADFDRRLLGDPRGWSPADVRRWLEAENLGEWGDAFETNEVDGETLLGLTTRDMADEIGVASLPARRKLALAIEKLGGGSAGIDEGGE